MRKLVALLALTAALAGPASAALPVDVKLILQKAVYTTGEPITLTIAVDKQAGGPFKVPPDFRSADWHRYLKVTGPNGAFKFGDFALEEKRLIWIRDDSTGRSIAADLVETLLNDGAAGTATTAGRVRTITIDLKAFPTSLPGGFSALGTYTVSFHRDYPSGTTFVADGEEYFAVGSAVSDPIPANTVTFEVVADPASPPVSLLVNLARVVEASSTILPMAGVAVRLFDARPGSQAASIGIDARNAKLIWDTVAPLATLSTPGTFTPLAGQYVAIAQVPNGASSIYVLSNRTAALAPGATATLYLRALERVDGFRFPGTSQLTLGSTLLTITPGFINNPSAIFAWQAVDGGDWTISYAIANGAGTSLSGPTSGSVALATTGAVAVRTVTVSRTAPHPDPLSYTSTVLHAGVTKMASASIPVLAEADLTPPTDATLLLNLQKSMIHFGSGSQWARFTGSIHLADGNLPEEFRSGASAPGTVEVRLAGATTPTYTRTFAYAVSEQERWESRVSSTEVATIRWKDTQYYDSTRDAAVVAAQVGALDTRFIHVAETRFRWRFENATLPVTIVVDGLVLVTARADGTVASSLPHWLIEPGVVEVAYPARLVPGNRVEWFRDGDPSDGLPPSVVFHDAAADGTATSTYFNSGGEFSIVVPVTGVAVTATPRTASLVLTIGGATTAKEGAGATSVPAYVRTGPNWRFNE